jgi:hypothetical protein
LQLLKARLVEKVTILRDCDPFIMDLMTSEYNNDDDAGNITMQQLSHFEHATEFQDLIEQLLNGQRQHVDKTYTRIQQIVGFVGLANRYC